ncbi:MAG: NAD(+) synthase, partial [Leptospiraceae bacterium]|nr:NAD(+) synthase [Leptospiraceae bacterium]
EVLKDICNTPISPELLPSDGKEITQKTENIIGPYELHDFFLYHFIRFQFSPSKILFMAEKAYHSIYSRKDILKWMKVFFSRFFQNQFKRSAMPDGPKIGSVALSQRGDWRMPSDIDSSLWLREIEELSNS